MENDIENDFINHPEELAYRRGFTHGVLAASNRVTLKQAYEWRNSREATCPPGTPFAGSKVFEDVKE